MNENGPKTRQEVRKEIEDKHAREQREREEGRGGGRHGGGNYNDKGGDRRGGGKGHNDRDRRDGGKQQYQEKKQTYQQKGRNDQPASPTKKGRGGGREEKKAEEAPVEHVDISDEDMGEKLNKNFDAYCASIKQLAEVEDDEETKQPTPEQLKPSYDLYKELKTTNGRPGDAIVAMLLSRVFGEETQKVEEHLTRYLMHLHKDKILTNHHFNGGISRMADILPDLALDLPAVHKFLYKYVVEPLLAANILDWKKINFVTPEDKSKKVEDDDDDIEFGTDPFFKFVALILAEQWKKAPDSINDFCKPWAAVIKEKFPKMDEADETLAEIQEEIGADAAKVIMPLLKA